MRVATIKIKGITPYSPSRPFQSEKKSKESPEDFDKRCWRERAHVNGDGEVVIPAEVTRKAIIETAEFLGKGGFLQKKGSAKWTENFQRALAVTESAPIGHTAESMKEPELVYCHADGNPKSGKRVWRRFPFFRDWAATLTVTILDDSIPEDVFERVVDETGVFNGFGRSSPRTKGQLGRFIVEECVITVAIIKNVLQEIQPGDVLPYGEAAKSLQLQANDPVFRRRGDAARKLVVNRAVQVVTGKPARLKLVAAATAVSAELTVAKALEVLQERAKPNGDSKE